MLLEGRERHWLLSSWACQACGVWAWPALAMHLLHTLVVAITQPTPIKISSICRKYEEGQGQIRQLSGAWVGEVPDSLLLFICIAR